MSSSYRLTEDEMQTAQFHLQEIADGIGKIERARTDTEQSAPLASVSVSCVALLAILMTVADRGLIADGSQDQVDG